MKLIKRKHSTYPNLMSASITLLRTKNYHFTLQEFYEPHWLEFNIWIRNKDEENLSNGFYVLKHWKKIALNREARCIIKSSKIPGNIEVIHKKLKEEIKEENK